MTAAALDQAYKHVSDITSELIAKPTNHKKSISAIIEVITLTTNTNSVTETKKLLKELVDIQEALPVNESDVNIIKCKTHLEFVNDHLTEINSFLDFIKLLFDNSNTQVEIDNDNMYEFLANMESAQSILGFISDYLTLVLKIQKNKSEEAKEYSLESLIEYIAA